MLKQLSIRNIAIIDFAQIHFESGFTVITGESGSGKSILLDSIELCFGAKMSPREMIKAGAERGQVELLFDIGNLSARQDLRQWLAEVGVVLDEEETEILLSRELSRGGSRSRINGVPVSRDILAGLRQWVIDLHGQHELTSLFQKETQRNYLDGFGGSALLTLKQQVSLAYEAWLKTKNALDALTSKKQELARQHDFLFFQWQELEAAQLENETEDAQIREKLAVLGNSETLLKVTAQAAALLNEGDEHFPSILDQMAKVQKKLTEGSRFDNALGNLLGQLEAQQFELKAIAQVLSSYAEDIELNPEQLAELTDRLDLLEKLKRKYGNTLAEVIAFRDSVAAQLAQVVQREDDFQALQETLKRQEAELAEWSEQLRSQRFAAAQILKEKLVLTLQQLVMSGVSFDIELTPTAFSREGTEEVTFLFSANPGEPLKPMTKVASGGELSRFLLAMKVLTAGSDGLLTLIFDEIDTGISGATVKVVAEKLAMLSRGIQVIAITHQPIIAAMAPHHIHVEKFVTLVDQKETVAVQVEHLSQQAGRRLQVLSRLVSGMDSGDEAVEKFIRRLQSESDHFLKENGISGSRPSPSLP